MKKIYAFLLIITSAFTFNAQCDYTLTMLDSWGDGWSGNTMDVLVNGSIVLDDATFASGASSDLTFSVSTSDNITTLWNGGGSYDYECSWEIKDNTGNVVGTGDYQTPMTAVTAACPSCIAPTALLSSNITATSADITWTAGGTETAWNIEYGPSGFASGSGTIVAATSPSYSFSGLNINSAYDFYVQADCGGGISSTFSSVASFSTSASTVTVPYSNDLETGNFGTDLAPTSDVNSAVTVSPGAANASNFGIQMIGGASPAGWTNGGGANGYWSFTSHISTVDITVDASAVSVVNLSFDHKQTYSFNAAYSWFRVTVDGTPIGADMQASTSSSDPFTNHSLDLSAYAGTTFTLSFQHSGKYDSTYNAGVGVDMSLIDNIVLSAPSCNAPGGFTAANTTDVSSDLSWTAGGTETAWNIEYGASGFTQGSGTTVAVTATSYQLTGLTPQSSYDVYVQADCGGGSTSSMLGPISITTLPTAGTCGFFTAELTDSWGDGWNGNGLEYSINGTVIDTLETTSADGQSPVSTLIAVNIGDVVDFNYILDAFGTGANTYPGENAYVIYDHAGIAIATEAGAGANGPASSLGLNACPSCTAPNTLTATNITNASADLGWVAGGSETAWNIEYGVNGFAQGAGTTVAVTANPYSLTGLTAATAYDYYIQSDCGSGDTSGFAGPYTFATLCNDEVAPYLENFDGGPSVCWSVINSVSPWTLGGAPGTPSPNTGPSDDANGGGNFIHLECTGATNAAGDSSFLISPNIDLSGVTVPELKFASHMYGADLGELSVHIVSAANPTPTMIWQKLGDQGNQWNEETVDLSAYSGTVQFIVLGVRGSDYTGDVAIDNFEVREMPGDDLSAVGLSSSAITGCDLTASETVSLMILNNAQNAQSNFPVSYTINGGTAVSETVAGPLNGGDTLNYTFTQTVDMSADGMYSIAASVDLATDQDTTNNAASMVVENQVAGTAPTTMGDSICNGDTAMVSASSTGAITWYDAMTGGNMLGTGSSLNVSPSANTSYYAEAMSGNSYFENFDSYSNGDLIAQVSNDWGTWSSPTGGGADDAAVSNMQAVSAPNSLNISNANGDDIVFPFGGLFATGTFKVEFDMYYTSSAYFNLQADTVIGNAWAFSCFFDTAGFTVESATGPNPVGSWFHFELVGDLNAGAWEVLIDGVTAGTFNNANPVASVNFYGNTGNDYYIDNVSYSSPAVACPSPRAEASVVVNDCSNINENGYNEFSVYPNPNSGSFFIENLGNSTAATVSITDVQGKEVYTTSFNTNNRINIDMNNLEKGMYMVTVKSENGVQIENVIVQ